MELCVPTTLYKDSYLAAVEEGAHETQLTKIDKPEPGQSFADFIEKKIGQSEGKHLLEGYVPATELWLIDNDEFVGWVNIRHSLTEKLKIIGGHIGYWIRPSKRNQGYGTTILRLAILKAKKLGITKILMTCDDDNMPSRRIIEANGGILEKVITRDEEKKEVKRYYRIDA